MKRMTAVLAICVAPLFAGNAWAQQTTTTTTQAPPGPVAGRAPLGVTVIEMEAIVIGWSVKRDLMGKTVMNDKKERIGKIEDLIVSPNPDAKMPHATFAIVGVGGFLGIGTKDVVIPMEQLKLTGGNLVLAGATKDALKALPEFKYQKR
jgi:sporulation protein YlmC with PRC-barrel domain